MGSSPLVWRASSRCRIRRDRAAEAIRIGEEEALRRASEERLRIARELHDAMGHHLSLVNVQVVALVAARLNNEEIARRLFISPATAKTHVSRAMVKLSARDRAQLVVMAFESGLVRPGWNG
jgi:DNA-binding CsgD family transcriptional regulator